MFCRASDDDLLVDEHVDGTILADRSPLVYGHLLVCPEQHSSSAAELDTDSQSRLLARVRGAQELAAAMTGRPAIAVEHGRSPTCSDPSGATHAHVHVLPVGEYDVEALAGWDAISPALGPGAGRYLAVYESPTPVYFVTHRHVLHAARSLATMVAAANAVPWRPLSAGPDALMARATATDARGRLARAATTLGASAPAEPVTPSRRTSRSTVVVSGPTGAGKSTVGAALARALSVPAVEIGVILRLACAAARPRTDAELATLLWRWHSAQRLDFGGQSRHGLAAALPRLDGSFHETTMWRDIDAQRLAELARGALAEEALGAIAAAVASKQGAVIVGRVGAELSGLHVVQLELDAAAAERARRKRAQLRTIGLEAAAHDWFTPRTGGGRAPVATPQVLDTSELSRPAMIRAALRRVGAAADEQACGRLAS